ncbi:MAG: hypothetical protein HY369_00870 [Candidatus Aenigmarchaeota archaeon]|nr:hypothetical protein [Candidatus Aenigmarchaeota archaeon]
MGIDRAQYGEVTVNGKTYYSDLVVWWEGRPALLEKTHLLDQRLAKRVLKPGTEAVVIGTGFEGTVKLLPPFTAALKRAKAKLFVDRTENAIDIFNAFAATGKKAVAILHVSL